MGVLIPLIFIVICCIIIWKASNGFEVSSEYLGRNLSDGVRGATINAIASSMPELFTTIFFLIYLKDTDGFSGGIGTTAGSAIFNGMIIPALVIFVVLFSKVASEIRVSKKVVLRDGLSLIAAETVLVFLISGDTLNWWHGFILIITYALYVFYMLSTMSSTKTKYSYSHNKNSVKDENYEQGFIKSLLILDLETLVIGKSKINNKNGWALLIISMLIIGAACLILVAACEMIGAETYTLPIIGELNGLNIPIMFVAVILASAATSLPDTILSIRDAQNGKYNDAISNALGSNIFDICFALGLPILLYSIFFSPIIMDPSTLDFSLNILIILFVLTIFTFVIFIWGDRLGIKAAILLISMYIFFILFLLFNYV